MFNFAFNSFKSERDRELLSTLREAIYVLKLQEQDALEENGYNQKDLQSHKVKLIALLYDLDTAVTSLVHRRSQDRTDFTYVNFATRFININPSDVHDRLYEISRLRLKLDQGTTLVVREFQRLDQLQSILEEEVALSRQGLFRF